MLTDAMKFFKQFLFSFHRLPFCLFLQFSNHTKRTIYLSQTILISLVKWRKVLNHFQVTMKGSIGGISPLFTEWNITWTFKKIKWIAFYVWNIFYPVIQKTFVAMPVDLYVLYRFLAQLEFLFYRFLHWMNKLKISRTCISKRNACFIPNNPWNKQSWLFWEQQLIDLISS